MLKHFNAARTFRLMILVVSLLIVMMCGFVAYRVHGYVSRATGMRELSYESEGSTVLEKYLDPDTYFED